MEAEEKFQISNDIAYYLLKHFESITLEEHQELEKAHKRSRQINRQFSTIGSKFKRDRISGYRQLLDIINSNEPDEVIMQNNGRKAHIFKFDFDIGTDHIQKISALTTPQKSQIITENRVGYIIRTIKIEAPSTKQLVVISDGLNVITAYPGTYGPPLPIETMDAALFEQCSRFWEEHVFINN